jgi:HSP20 family protein
MANLIRRDNREVSRNTSPDRLDPFRVMDALLRWDPFRNELTGVTSGGDFTPRFDVKETKDAYLIRADAPGVKDEDLDVSLNGNMLTITGRREDEHHEEGESYYTMERGYGTFARSFSLPDSVDAEHVTAELKHGVLTLRIPKRPEAQPRKITIGRSGSESNAKA